MKKLLALILTLCMVLSMLPVGVIAADEAAAETAPETVAEETAELLWEYELYGEGVALTKYLGTATDVYAPGKIEADGTKYPVIKLGDSLFEDNDALNSVTLGDGITEIGARVFYDADNLVCIVTNEQLTTIGAEAFYSCDSFNSIILYDAVTSIGTEAFSGCPELTVWCNEGTAGYTYAVENSIPYEILNPNATPETYVQDGITYYLYNGEAVAISCDKTLTEAVVPAYINGYPVTELRSTFKNCMSLESITLSEGIKTIGRDTFNFCRVLTTVNIPQSVTYIGTYAFYVTGPIECVEIPAGVTKIEPYTFDQSDINKVILNEGLESIGVCAFSDCSKLTEANIPSTVTSIGEYAFSYCSLLSVEIPDGITEIGKCTFEGCDFSSVIIPDSVKVVGESAFSYCSNLSTLVLSDNLESIGNSAFSGLGKLTELTIPDSVKEIGNNAFAKASKLESLTLSSNLTEIGSLAFSGCVLLRQTTVPDCLTKVGEKAFPNNTVLIVNDGSDACTLLKTTDFLYFVSNGIEAPQFYTENDVLYYIFNGEAVAVNCSENQLKTRVIPEKISGYPVTQIRSLYTSQTLSFLEHITLPDTIKIIGGDAFSGCPFLTDINIPAGVTTIGDYAFSQTDIEQIALPDGLTSIGEGAFFYCAYLKSITIPESVQTIGNSAFRYCTSLESIDLPCTITEIENDVFSECTSLKNVEIPDSVTSIGREAFYNCSSLETVIIPESVESIGSLAYYGCSSLTAVTLSSNLTTVSGMLFRGCTSLSSVTMPEGIKTIDSNAFQDCTSLQSILIPNSVTSIQSNSFKDNIVLLVYENSYAHSFAKDSERLYFIYDGVTMPEFTNVDGLCYYIANNEAILFNIDASLTDVTILDSVNGYPVTDIGTAFAGNTAIKSVTLPDTIERIASGAFKDCTALTTVNIPEGVTEIGDYAFSYSALTSIDIPDSVVTIGSNAFHYCSSITELVIPDSVTSMGKHAFSYMSSLEKIKLSENITEIPDHCFCACGKLNNLVIPEGVTYLGTTAFFMCYELETIILPDTLEYISSYAFEDCSSLLKIFIPTSVYGVVANAFHSGTILMAYEGSDTLSYLSGRGFLTFPIQREGNPEVAYGTGLSGTVTYTDGSVAAGVNVEIIYDDGVSKESVVTDENGVYEFTYAEVGAYTIRATDAEDNTFATPVSVKRMNAFDVFTEGDTDLTLKKGYNVSGTVSEGGATVTVTDGDANVITSVNADENGAFTIENLPNGTYVITATTEQGSASTEVTVYNNDVSDITLTIATETVTLWGYVEVEDREFKHHRRNWVQITVYNEEGVAVAQRKSDGEGKYTFKGLPTGEYSIVAETAEMRKDKKHGFDRSHILIGYAYVSALTAGEYEVDTIVLYEENDHTATISGKVTANGQVNNSEVRLINVFRHEVAKMTTGSNGKYSFKNIKDGLYFIIATTEKDGSGMAVVSVINGKVYGDTDIKVLKTDKIKDREDRFKNDIPDLDDRDGIHDYCDRIAEEKRFYDGLSEKEKRQLSRDYTERLNKYCEWLANTEYTADDDVKVEGGGLILSGDELESEDTVSFNIDVTKKDAHNASTDGVHGRDDFIHHRMNDTANGKDIVQYYEITMSKTVGGEEKAITSVYKDTDATGKFRITITIPEEYRGHAQYTMLHEHHGEVVTLADLDDDPDTITVEVDRFSTFALAASDESNIGEVGAETGDVNADEVINVLDMTLTARYIAQGGVSGTYDLTACDTDAMDANADGAIDQLDLNAIAAIIRVNG